MDADALPAVDARRAVAAELRRLADALVSDDRPEGAWAAVADALRAIGPDAPPEPIATGYTRLVAASDPAASTHRHHPLSVGANAVFPDVELIARDDRSIHLALAFSGAWEGPAGTVHGGFVAAAFDIACSSVAADHLGPCVTRNLRLRYLRPTPLHRRLDLVAERGEREGRLMEVQARLLLDERVTVKAVAEFASL